VQEQYYASQGRDVERRSTRKALIREFDRRTALRAAQRQAAVRKFLMGPVRQVYGNPSFAQAPLVQPTEFQKGAADLKTLGTSPFLGAYELGRGGYEAVTGQGTKRLQKLGKGVVEGVVHSSPGELAQGNLKKAYESAAEHPLIAALDYAGATAIAGRTVGAVGRTATKGKRFSTVRSPIALSNDAGAVKQGAYVERRASKDVTRSAIQKARDAKREPVRDADGKPVTVLQSGKRVPVLRSTAREQERWAKREGDFRAGRGNAKERLDRELAAREVKIKGVRGKKGRDLVAMVVEGTIPGLKHPDPKVLGEGGAFTRYLTDHAKRLDAEYAARMKSDPKGYRHSAEAQMNRDRAKVAREAATDHKVTRQARQIVAEGERIGRELNAQERRALKMGVLSDSQRARRSGLIPAAIEHLGARRFSEQEHAKLERTARVAEEKALDALHGVRRGKGEAPGAERREIGRLPSGERRRQLQREYDEARAHRIAVSGRDPAGVEAHEKARSTAETARSTERSARAKIARLEKSRQRLVGAQSSRRGRRQGEARKDALKSARGERPEGKATPEERAKLAEIDRAIKQARKEAGEAAQQARKAEHALKRTPLPKTRAGVRTSEGKGLSDADIERALRDRGRDPESVAYLPHVPPGNAAYHARAKPGDRPVIDKPGPEGTRTGEAYRKGATEASADLIQQQGVKLATQINKAEQLDALVQERGLVHPDFPDIEAKAARGDALTPREQRLLKRGGYFTGKEAEEYAKRVLEDEGTELVAMRAYADRLSETTKELIRGQEQNPAAMESLHRHLLNDRIIPTAELSKEGARNVVLVPAALVKRLEDHLAPAGEIEKFLQMVNRPFRFAVLAQPRWLTGNFVEPYLVRLPTVGSGAINVPGMLNDIRIAQKTLKRMERSGDPKTRAAAKEIRAQHLGGLLANRGLSNRRTFEDTKAYKSMVSKLPAVKHLYELAHKAGQVAFAPGRAYFWANRELIEKWAQKASLGRSIRRDAHEYFGSMRKAVRFGEEAAEEAARGLTNTPTQLRFLREQQILLGKYGDFSPRLRRAVQGPMPFLPWALNAARFVYWTMPAHHTALTALLVKTSEVFADEWEKEHADLPPSLQESSLAFDRRRDDGGFTPGIRYTPYGLTAPITQGNFEAVDQSLPAIAGPINALKGLDPFNRPLTAERTAENPEGKVRGWGKVGVAGNQLFEALTPYISQIRRLREGGSTGLSTSNVFDPDVKPNTDYMSGARRTYDPFRPTYVNPPGGKGGVQATKGPAPKLSRAERLLERRAARLESTGDRQQRVDDLLEKRARRLAGG